MIIIKQGPTFIKYWKIYKFPSGKYRDGVGIHWYKWDFKIGYDQPLFNTPYCQAVGSGTWIPCKENPWPEGIEIKSKLKRRIADGFLRSRLTGFPIHWSRRPETGFNENLIQLGAYSMKMRILRRIRAKLFTDNPLFDIFLGWQWEISLRYRNVLCI